MRAARQRKPRLRRRLPGRHHIDHPSDSRIAVERRGPAPHHLNGFDAGERNLIPVNLPGFDVVERPPVEQHHHILGLAAAIETADGRLRVVAEAVEAQKGKAGCLSQYVGQAGDAGQPPHLRRPQHRHGGRRGGQQTLRPVCRHHDGSQRIDPRRVQAGIVLRAYTQR